MDLINFYNNGKHTDIFAFYGPCDGKYDDGTPMGDGTDFRIKERYIEYKNCGFDILLMEDEADYRGEPFESSKVKEIMDICLEIGLKVIVLDRRIYYLAIKGYMGKEIDGFKIDSLDDLNKLVAFYMKDYSRHPAFYGVYVMDEPGVEIIDGVSRVVGAIKAVDKNCFVHICHTIPSVNYSIKQSLAKRDNWTEIGWDHYFFNFYNLPNRRVSILTRSFHLYAEMYKKFATQNNLKFTMVTLQAFGGDLVNGVSGIGWRQVDGYDLRYQTYATLLYYPDKIGWFHYWASKHNVNRNTEKSIMNEFGQKVMYDEAKALNAEMKALTTVMNHFTYNGVNLFCDKREKAYYFLNERDFVLRDMNVDKVKGAVIISEGIDKVNDLAGYLIHNSTDPKKRKTTKLKLSFNNAKEVIIYKKGKPEKVALKDGKLSLKLPCADGVYLIPLK